jgi:hypothetical protein
VPVAVVTAPSETFELKSVPGGTVEVRRMTYGQHLYRQSIAARMLMLDEKKHEAQGEIKPMQEAVALWEFANLVGEHNLTDEDGKLLNFKNPSDVRRLEGRVGDEISSYIDKLNNFKDVEEGNSLDGSEPPSSRADQ